LTSTRRIKKLLSSSLTTLIAHIVAVDPHHAAFQRARPPSDWLIRGQTPTE